MIARLSDVIAKLVPKQSHTFSTSIKSVDLDQLTIMVELQENIIYFTKIDPVAKILYYAQALQNSQRNQTFRDFLATTI